MLLRGLILGWMIQVIVAAVLWLPLVLISDPGNRWQEGWGRAWGIGGIVRLWVCVASWAFLGFVLLVWVLGQTGVLK